MTEYTVGLRLGKKSQALTIEAEDAFKVKHNYPDALIVYVRKANRRGALRQLHDDNAPAKRDRSECRPRAPSKFGFQLTPMVTGVEFAWVPKNSCGVRE
jgi:hypothetical protein